MVVAAGAAGGEPKPCEACGFNPVDNCLDAPFFSDQPAFAVEAVIALETGGNELFLGGIRQHVTSNLLDGELVKRQVAVVGIDDPVAPWPHRPARINLEAVAVSKTGHVEPFQRHALPITR